MIYLASMMGSAATDAMNAIRLDVPAWLEPDDVVGVPPTGVAVCAA